jgi:hypothetical protein
MERLAIAKGQVEQPTQPTIKLKMSSNAPKPSQSIKIKFGSNKASPGVSSPASTPGPERNTPGVIVHNEALERQQQMVAAGMNGLFFLSKHISCYLLLDFCTLLSLSRVLQSSLE